MTFFAYIIAASWSAHIFEVLGRLVNSPGNALARVQQVHEPADLWDITFCTSWFWGPELSFIEQTAPADPNP